ncbi:MAG: hypothetical protein ACODAJ_15845, partial [Planctomycetota bacterium]
LALWAREAENAIPVSASEGEGLEELTRRIVEALVGEVPPHRVRPVIFTARQADHLRQALAALEASRPEDARDAIARLIG